MNTASQGRLRALIVDDEALARRGLEIRLGSHPDVELIGESTCGREALDAIRSLKPDVVFLDIQMPGLSGFDVLAELQAHELPLVVFVTAYDTYAIRAFEARALDYLLKPVEDDRLATALEHVRKAAASRVVTAERDQLIELLASIRGSGEFVSEGGAAGTGAQASFKTQSFLPIRTGREVVRVEMSTIDWIDAAGDYLCIHAAGATHILRGTMKEMEEMLDPATFQRVHRSTIVNLNRVASLRAHMNGEYFLKLTGGQELKLSRSYRDKLEHFLARPRAN
jgi:two-component system, LytTR family, response regulator